MKMANLTNKKELVINKIGHALHDLDEVSFIIFLIERIWIKLLNQ